MTRARWDTTPRGRSASRRVGAPTLAQRLARRVALLVTIGLLLTLAGCGDGGGTSAPPSTPLPTADHPDGYPVGLALGDHLWQADDAELARVLDRVVDLGANSIRVDMSWADLQPDDPTSFDWTPMDRIVAAAAQRHLNVLGILTYTPPWARGPGCLTFACPPASVTAFAAFAGAVAARYAGQGVSGYEIWNEPNLPMFWAGPDPVAYRNLLAPTVAAVHAADPAAQVITGGLAPNQSIDGAVRADDFLRQACETGLCADVDGIGIHPYTFPAAPDADASGSTAWQVMTRSVAGRESLLNVLGGVGLSGKPLVITEFGAPTGGPGLEAKAPAAGVDHVSEDWQAHIVADGIRLAEADPGRLAAIFVYTLDDIAPTDGAADSTEDHFGLLRTDGSEKPAYRAFAAAVSGS